MCQIPTGRPLTSSYVWHFLFLITAGTDQASFFFRGGGALWIFSAHLFSALLNGCGCSAAIGPPEVFRMSWVQLYRPGSGCFVFPLRERIIRQGFDIYFSPFWFLTVTHFCFFFPLVYLFFFLWFLFLGCQGQPGEGPVGSGRHIGRGGEGRGSGLHRGQRGHCQGSGVDLRYVVSAAAPRSQYRAESCLVTGTYST